MGVRLEGIEGQGKKELELIASIILRPHPKGSAIGHLDLAVSAKDLGFGF